MHIRRINSKELETPISIGMRRLTPKDIDQMVHLSCEISNTLKQNQKKFIYQYTHEKLNNMLNDPTTHFFGVFSQNKLIGMSYIKFVYSQEELNTLIPNAQENITVHPKEPIAIFGADSVLEAYRGNKLNIFMIQKRIEEARKHNCHACLSVIDRSNHWNMTPYFNKNFTMISTAIDPSDGGDISLMHLNLRKEENYSATRHEISFSNFIAIDHAISRGYQGIAINQNKKTILFAKRKIEQTATKEITLSENRKMLIIKGLDSMRIIRNFNTQHIRG